MVDLIAWYLPFILTISLLIVTWRYGDWRNWRKYYPTILYIVLVNLFSYVLTFNYPLWLFHKTFLIPNRMLNEFRLDFLFMPALILLYLTYYPFGVARLRQFVYIMAWGTFCSLAEAFYMFTNVYTYHNGWSIWWSAIVWYLMFVVMAIHLKKPPWAWLICLFFSVFVIFYFNIPLGSG